MFPRWKAWNLNYKCKTPLTSTKLDKEDINLIHLQKVYVVYYFFDYIIKQIKLNKFIEDNDLLKNLDVYKYEDECFQVPTGAKD